MARREKKPSEMAAALEEAFASLGLTDVARRLKITQAWQRAVGPKIAERTEPEAFRRGTLIVRTPSAAWQNELVFLRQDIIRKVNEALGTSMVKELKIVTGRVAGPVQKPLPPWVKAAPHREDIAKADATASVIADEGVRSVVAGVIEKALRFERFRK